MTRTETVIAIDQSAIILEKVAEALYTMGATHSMCSRVQSLIEQLDILRVDVIQCDLANEPEGE